jgi:Na+-translocating ferredoxin:NAD+ oxidoreductase subunit B
VSIDPYQRLVDALDALPNGFPRTPSGNEVLMIKKVFAPDEVEVAGQMSRRYETTGEISVRSGLPAEKVEALLEAMRPRSLVRQRTIDDVQKWRLGPFIIGWYEGYMPLMDREFADLFEVYMAEGGSDRILAPHPGIMRVVPVRGSLKPELIQSYDDIDAHFQRHERFAVVDCVCRVERNLVGGDCHLPVMRCSFTGLPPQTPLSENILDREHALKLFSELEEMGHVHLAAWGYGAADGPAQYNGGCQCCGDCCAILRGTTDWGLPDSPQRSNFRAVFDSDLCITCGVCIERCQLDAVTEGADGTPSYDRSKCIGCGQCVIKCPTEAAELKSVSEDEWWDVPPSFEQWEEERMKTLGMTP